jgi:quercetin dioxygenase-like cupin family protein
MKKACLTVICVLVLSLGFEPTFRAQTKQETPPSAQDKNKPKVVAVNTADLEAFSYDAGTVKFITTSEDTKGAFAVLEVTEMPGYKTTWHRHNHTEETFYVLEGVLTVKINDKVAEFPAGSYVLIPRGTTHGQGNFGKVPVKVILTVSPGGYEQRFRERIELYKTTKPGDPDFQKKLVGSRGNVDSEVLGEWSPSK